MLFLNFFSSLLMLMLLLGLKRLTCKDPFHLTCCYLKSVELFPFFNPSTTLCFYPTTITSGFDNELFPCLFSKGSNYIYIAFAAFVSGFSTIGPLLLMILSASFWASFHCFVSVNVASVLQNEEPISCHKC